MLDAPVAATDRGFLYGDGVFETMLAVAGRIAFAQLHLERLARGCERLGIPVALSRIEELLGRTFEPHPQALRLTVSRGSGPRGYAPPEPCTPQVRLVASPLGKPASDTPARLIFSSVTLARQPLLAGIKHCNRLEQVLAAREARALGADEALLLTEEGHAQCGIASNVFAIFGARLVTPPVERSGVAGTRRRLVIERLAREADLAIEEAPLSRADCLRADGLFLTSALIGVRAVATLDDKTLDPHHPALRRLQASYTRALDECVATS